MGVSILDRRGPLRVCYSYFGLPKDTPLCDVHRVRNIFSPLEEDWICREDNTLCIDLSLGLGAIMKQMHESTRYKVRRAAHRDSLEVNCVVGPTTDCVEKFKSLHRQFLAVKGMGEPDYSLAEKLNAQSALHVSFVRHQKLGELAFHLHMFDGDRVRLVWSGHTPSFGKSDINSLVGRANRFLHWEDFAHFKKLGLGCYDFGGIYLKNDDPRMEGITQFKQGFGGQIRHTYNCVKGITLKGRLAVLLRRMMAKID